MSLHPGSGVPSVPSSSMCQLRPRFLWRPTDFSDWWQQVIHYTVFVFRKSALPLSPYCPVLCRQLISNMETLSWVHICNVTAYRNAESWRCGRDSWPRNVTKVGYAVTLRACSACCWYLVVASKGWCGYGLSRCERATWHVTTYRSFLFFFFNL